jgi:hypothetical protein
MDYEPVTRRSDLILAVSCLLVFGAVALISTLERALVFAVASGVFLAIIQTQPVARRDERFWRLIGALALVHVLILSFVPLREFQFGLIVLPFALVDGFAVWALVKWWEKQSNLE